MNAQTSSMVLLGEPYLGETKFHYGDVIKCSMFPNRERLTVLSIEIQDLNPFCEVIVYELESSTKGRVNAYKDVLEADGFYEVETPASDGQREAWEMLTKKFREGKMHRLN